LVVFTSKASEKKKEKVFKNKIKAKTKTFLEGLLPRKYSCPKDL